WRHTKRAACPAGGSGGGGGSGSGSGPRLPQHRVHVDRSAVAEQFLPAALGEQALLLLPALTAVVLQPGRPPPLLDHLAERGDVAGVGDWLAGIPQRL